MKTMIRAPVLHAESMMNDPEYRAGYDSLDEEFALIETLLRARKHAAEIQHRATNIMERIDKLG